MLVTDIGCDGDNLKMLMTFLATYFGHRHIFSLNTSGIKHLATPSKRCHLDLDSVTNFKSPTWCDSPTWYDQHDHHMTTIWPTRWWLTTMIWIWLTNPVRLDKTLVFTVFLVVTTLFSIRTSLATHTAGLKFHLLWVIISYLSRIFLNSVFS